MSIASVHASTAVSAASATSPARSSAPRRDDDVRRDQPASETERATFSEESLALSHGTSGRADDFDFEVNEEGATQAAPRQDGSEGALSEAEQRQVEKLKARDAEVRAHEAAHMAAGGAHVRGGASYTYQQGPDGKSYAVGGEVGIDVSPVRGNARATIQKMQQIRAAALAPAEPSGADRAVAAKAAQAEARASAEMAQSTRRPASDAYQAASAPASAAGSGFNETA